MALNQSQLDRLASGVQSIEVPIDQLAEIAGESVAKVARKLIAEMFASVIQKSPRDTGRFAANWNVSLSGPDYSYNWDRTTPDSIREHVIPNMPMNTDTVEAWLSNGLPYAAVLEYGLYPDPPKGGAGKTTGGYSTQAPQGMIRVTVAEFQTHLDKVLNR